MMPPTHQQRTSNVTLMHTSDKKKTKVGIELDVPL